MVVSSSRPIKTARTFVCKIRELYTAASSWYTSLMCGLGGEIPVPQVAQVFIQVGSWRVG